MDHALLLVRLPLTAKMADGSQIRTSEAVVWNPVLTVCFRSGYTVFGRTKEGEAVRHPPLQSNHLRGVHLRSLYVCVACQLLGSLTVSWPRSHGRLGPSRTEVNEVWKGVRSEMEQPALQARCRDQSRRHLLRDPERSVGDTGEERTCFM